MLRQGRLESGRDGVRQFGNAQSHAGSKDKNRSVAGGMHEGRLHEGKPEDIPQTGQRNSFGRAVRSTESAVSENREREEDPGLIYSDSFQTGSRREKNHGAIFFGHSECSEESMDFAVTPV
jgi:hypothetical protein